MDRKQRVAKAALVRQAIQSMRDEYKTASSDRRAEIYEDIDLAMGDYMNYMDDDYWLDEGDDLDEGLDDDLDLGDLDDPDLEDEPVEEFMHHVDSDEFIESMDDDHLSSDDVPMGAMDDHDSKYAQEDENRQHISYILDRVADVVASIESYEERMREAGKPARSAGARKAIASNMKELAGVVASQDLKVASTGDALDSVGVKVMAMHQKVVS